MRWQGRCLVIDGGIGPSRFHSALRRHKIDPQELSGLVLSHIHGDHCHAGLVRDFIFRDLPVYAHESHFSSLAGKAGLTAYMRKKLVAVDPTRPNRMMPGWELRAHPIPHGDMVNQGFVIEVDPGLFEPALRVGYLTDLGTWDDDLARFAANCDLLGLEFNHDEKMQLKSGRPWFLIQRNLGDDGHLSNTQAAKCLARIGEFSQSRRLKGLIQLHLSRSCNLARLARKAARTEALSQQPSGKKGHPPTRIWTCEPGSSHLRIIWNARLGRLRQVLDARTPAVRPTRATKAKSASAASPTKPVPGRYGKKDLFGNKDLFGTKE